MSQVIVDRGTTPGSREPAPERPTRATRLTRGDVAELVGSAVAALALVWTVFSIAGLSARFGEAVCWVIAFFVIYGLLSWRQHGPLQAKDRLGTLYVGIGSFLALAPLVAIMWFVFYKGLPVVWAKFPHFIFSDSSTAGGLDPVTKSGVSAAIVGTIEQVGIATVAVVPFAIATATYLNETRGPFARLVASVVDAMTGMPELIAGLFIYLLWVEPRGTGGKSGFAAAMALSVMMLPFVTRSAQEVLRIVPDLLREAALALGSPRWRMTLRVVLPTARTGLVTVVILGIARAVGETAAVLFTAGGVSQAHINWDPFKGPQLNLPLYIFHNAFAPSANQVREAWGAALILVLMVLTLFMLARLVGSSPPGGGRWRRLRVGPRGSTEPADEPTVSLATASLED